jgi:hypothetical protein
MMGIVEGAAISTPIRTSSKMGSLPKNFPLALGAIAAGLLLTACITTGPQMSDAGIAGPAIELTSTAFFPDERNQAAPGALATLLYTDGMLIGPDAVTPLLAADGGQRPLQPDLISTVLAFDRVPTVLAPGYAAPLAELRAGRPVMVLLARVPPGAATAVWQYAVLIGVDPEQNRFILRDGLAGRRFMRFGDFDSAWVTGGRWALVTTRPDELPATIVADDWIAAVDAATAAKKPDMADAMLATAIAKWGESAVTWVATGNLRYARRDLDGATRAYRKAIELKPDNSVAHNNLAEVLLDRHCVDAAQDEIDAALAIETDPKLRARYEGTQVMIHRHAGPSIYCPTLADDDAGPSRYEGVPVDLDAMPVRRAPRARPAKKPRCPAQQPNCAASGKTPPAAAPSPRS